MKKYLKVIFTILIFPALLLMFYYIGVCTMGEPLESLGVLGHLIMVFFGVIASLLFCGILFLVGAIANGVYQIIFDI